MKESTMDYSIVIDSPEQLEQWLNRAATAHHQYEQQLGHADENWAAWYARFIVSPNNHPKEVK